MTTFPESLMAVIPGGSICCMSLVCGGSPQSITAVRSGVTSLMLWSGDFGAEVSLTGGIQQPEERRLKRLSTSGRRVQYGGSLAGKRGCRAIGKFRSPKGSQDQPRGRRHGPSGAHQQLGECCGRQNGQVRCEGTLQCDLVIGEDAPPTSRNGRQVPPREEGVADDLRWEK